MVVINYNRNFHEEGMIIQRSSNLTTECALNELRRPREILENHGELELR